MIVDTSALIALLVRKEPQHDAVVAAMTGYQGRLLVSPLVLTELDYLMTNRVNARAALDSLRELATGAWQIAPFTSEDLIDAVSVVERYPELNIGVTDASLVVLADRYRTHTIATLDRRHFGVLRALDGKPFRLVPAL